MPTLEKQFDLSVREAAFVEHYLICGIGNEAALAAGYSASSARIITSRLLTRPNVAAAIAWKRKQMSDRNDNLADRVVQELARVAFADVRNLLAPDGSVRRIDELDDDTARVITAVDVYEQADRTGEVNGYVKKIKMADKMAALNTLARHLGLFELDNKQQGGAMAEKMSELMAVVYTTPPLMPRAEAATYRSDDKAEGMRDGE